MEKQTLGLGNFLVGIFIMLLFGTISYVGGYLLYDDYRFEKILYSEGVITDGLVIKQFEKHFSNDNEYFITYTFDVGETTIKNTVEVESHEYHRFKEGKQTNIIYIPDYPEWNGLHGIRSSSGAMMVGLFFYGLLAVVCTIAILGSIIMLIKGGYSSETFFVTAKERKNKEHLKDTPELQRRTVPMRCCPTTTMWSCEWIRTRH